MKSLSLLALMLCIFSVNALAAMDHSGHRGGGGSESSSSSCVKPHINKQNPVRLAQVSPGSVFSFVAFNIDDPDQISVTVKKQPVAIKTEFKNPFYVISGRLPDNIHDTAARIDVKIDSKYSSCRLNEGWLINILNN
jgi:hypothetical protein